MALFVDVNARVPVIYGEHTVYIRAKMSAKVQAQVQDEMRARGFGKNEDLEVQGMGSYRLALLIHNIVGWDGPEFEHVPCNRTNIERIDPNDPLWDAVAEEIGKRNAAKESPDPNSPTSDGSTIDGVARLVEP
jgi:hypothetical protein